ncbi:MAG: hypothetical protein GX681_05925 [Clostridiaceae bacterium]|jgi:hypothetical protein|nr:hypothetical protein [Clostridiaceae bacterium]
MARYCFYCGKELEDNEKCYCRARTRAESAARSASNDQGDSVYQEQTAATSSSASYDPGQSSKTDTSAGAGTNSSSNTGGKTNDKKDKRQENKEKRKAERERLKAAKAEAKRRSKAEKERRRQSYQAGPAAGSNPYRQRTNTYGNQQLRSFGRDLLQLLTRPADAIKAQAVPFWSLSHTILLIAGSFLGGAHFAFTNKWLYSVLFSQRLQAPNLQGAGLYFTGVLISALFLLLYAGILWILSRFLFRQGGLPFSHTLAVGKTAWIYLILFMLIALPTTIQGGFFGIFLVLMGFAFSSLVHARSVAVITHLTENQTMNLTLVSILIFTSLFASVIALFQTIQLA